MEFKKGEWYRTSDGYSVEFITSIEEDGMYNVFRHGPTVGYNPYYTDENGKTAYGAMILEHK